MKNIYLLFIILIFSYKTYSSHLLGEIKLPKNISNDLEIPLLFNGEIFNINKDENIFILKDKNLKKIGLLVTKSSNISIYSKENNTIESLKLNFKKYKFYEFTRKDNSEEITWAIKEKSLKSLVEIPLNTIILPLDFEKVTISFEIKNSKKKSQITKLPAIIINETKNFKLNEELLKCCLSFINLKPFHSKQEKKEIIQDKLKISMLADE